MASRQQAIYFRSAMFSNKRKKVWRTVSA